MRSWTVDADDIKIAEDFDDALLHKPPWLEGFLGAGGVVCIPVNALLDKPIGDKIFSKDMLELYAHSTEWWSKVWLISIAAAVLKRLDQLDHLRVTARL